MVAVLGISESSQADLLAAARPARHEPAARRARAVVLRRGGARCRSRPRRCSAASSGVRRSPPCATLDGVTVRRTDLIAEAETGGIAVAAADPALPATLGAHAARAGASSTPPPGATRRSCSARAPRTSSGIADTGSRVSGSAAAGSPSSGSSSRSTLAPDARRRRRWSASTRRRAGSAPSATRRRSTCAPTRTRSSGVRDLLGATANPERPEEVEVSRPVRRAGGARGRQDRVHVAVPRPRRGRAARRRRRDRQRDGDLGARAALGDRPAPRARRHAAPRRRPVPVRVAAARGGGRRGGRRAGRAGHRAATRQSQDWTHGRPAGGARRRRWRRRSLIGAVAGSTRRCARRGWRRPTRCAGLGSVAGTRRRVDGSGVTPARPGCATARRPRDRHRAVARRGPPRRGSAARRRARPAACCRPGAAPRSARRCPRPRRRIRARRR